MRPNWNGLGLTLKDFFMGKSDLERGLVWLGLGRLTFGIFFSPKLALLYHKD